LIGAFRLHSLGSDIGNTSSAVTGELRDTTRKRHSDDAHGQRHYKYREHGTGEKGRTGAHLTQHIEGVW
jgi:hypothetical protein